MKRGFALPLGCSNLSDRIRVVSARGTDLGVLSVAEAQNLAREQDANLVQIARGNGMRVFRLVDTALRSTLRKKK